MTALEKPLTTYTLRAGGLTSGQPAYDCTAATLLEAVQMLEGFERAAYLEPISPQAGCSTYGVYVRAPLASGAHWSRIGVVYESGRRLA